MLLRSYQKGKNENVSKVASIKIVRDNLVNLQRKISNNKKILRRKKSVRDWKRITNKSSTNSQNRKRSIKKSKRYFERKEYRNIGLGQASN